jgi:hypothetical protein
MAQYNLNISHNNLNENITYSEAVELLNDYKYHRVGQPIAIIFYDDNNERQLMLAIGKRDYTDPINGVNSGEDFYEIINKKDLAGDDSVVIIIKDNDVYMRGVDPLGNTCDYRLLNKKHANYPTEDTDIVTAGYLVEWCSFQEIK